MTKLMIRFRTPKTIILDIYRAVWPDRVEFYCLRANPGWSNGFSFMENLEGEVWKDVEGYEGRYQISNLGRARSLPRPFYRHYHNCVRKGVVKARILRQYIGIHGYWVVGFSDKLKLTHRLIAQAFIENPNPEIYKVVNHKNSIRTDNRIENLEWCTPAQNMYHAMDLGRMKKPPLLVGKNNPKSKPVGRYSPTGQLLKVYESVRDTLKDGYSSNCVGQVCNGKFKYHKGFNFRFL